MLAAMTFLAVLARRGIMPATWRAVKAHPAAMVLLMLGLLAAVIGYTYMKHTASAEALRQREKADLRSVSNLFSDPLLTSNNPVTLEARSSITSNLMLVQPGESYRYSIYITA